MNTLILKAQSAVSRDTAILKKVGFLNIRYFSDKPSELDMTKPSAIVPFTLANDGNTTTVIIEGATIYKVNNGVVDLSTSYTNEVTFSASEFGVKGVAFRPTKKAGYIRVQNGFKKITNLSVPTIALTNSAKNIQVGIDFSALPNNFSINPPTPASGYTYTGVNWFGDINRLSRVDKFSINAFLAGNPVLIDSLSNNVWDEKIKYVSGETSSYYFNISAFPIVLDLSIFDNLTAFTILTVLNTKSVVKGNINKLLSIVSKLTMIESDNSLVTGSINSLSTNILEINVSLPSVTGGYTSRAYSRAISTFGIEAPLVPATDYDRILSDLATRAPLLSTSAPIKVYSRTSASDGAVAALIARGNTVTVTNP